MNIESMFNIATHQSESNDLYIYRALVTAERLKNPEIFENALKKYEPTTYLRRIIFNFIVTFTKNRELLEVAYTSYFYPIGPDEYSYLQSIAENIYWLVDVLSSKISLSNTTKFLLLVSKVIVNYYQHPINTAIIMKNEEAIEFFREREDLAISDSSIRFCMRFGNVDSTNTLIKCGVDRMRLLRDANRYQNNDVYLDLYLKSDLPNIYSGDNLEILRGITIKSNLSESECRSECQICFQELTKKVDIDCGHTFHLECIREAASVRCPICTNYFKKIENCDCMNY